MNHWYKLLIFTSILISLAISGCKNQNKQEPMQEENSSFQIPEWAKDACIYEVNIRQYTPEGTFKAFQSHLPRLKEMGVSILWFMPIYPISDARKKGTLGSYYAVSDFKNTNPKFGTPEEFKAVVEQAHSLGMKVILDWVPNHTGWDHIWMKSNPDFYTKNANGEIIDPLNEKGESMGWTDVADLNYDNRALWDSMYRDMLYWVENFNIDGFRQDMAMLVPLEFWKETNAKLLQRKPDLFFLAESEEKDHINQNAFHACYGWSFHHLLNDIAKGNKKASDIDQWQKTEGAKIDKGMYMHFITNHDENSWSGSEIERMGDAYKTMAVLVHTFDGIPLVYSGQEEPLVKRLEFFEKDTIPFQRFENGAFYQKLMMLKKDFACMQNLPFGGKTEKILNHDHVYAFQRVKNGKNVCILLNLSGQPQTIQSQIDFEGKDLFSGYPTVLQKGKEFQFAPWQYFVIIPN